MNVSELEKKIATLEVMLEDALQIIFPGSRGRTPLVPPVPDRFEWEKRVKSILGIGE